MPLWRKLLRSRSSRFLDAAADGDLEQVWALLEKNPDLVFRRDRSGRTALDRATLNGKHEVAQVLRQRGGLLSDIFMASRLGDIASAEALIRGNPNLVLSRDEDGLTPLHRAAQSRRADIAELLLANGADVDDRGKHGERPMDVVFNWDAGMMDLLRCHGGHFGSLVNAASQGDLEGVTLLLKGDFVPAYLQEAFRVAVNEGYLDVVALLLAGGADVKGSVVPYTPFGNAPQVTPLHWAVDHGREKIAELLLANGADPNVNAPGFYQEHHSFGAGPPGWEPEERGGTPLHGAAYYGYEGLVKLLIAAGAEVNAKDRDGETPLHLAVRMGYKAELSVEYDRGQYYTKVHVGSSGSVATVKLLLAARAQVDAEDRHGSTPLGLANDLRRRDIAELLRAKRADLSAKDRLGGEV